MSPAETIARIAEIAEALAWQAGVGGQETAGGFVSYLAKHPEHVEAFLARGVFELPDDWFRNGCLTWYAMNGKVVTPEEARHAVTIKKMKIAGGLA